jgi:hypothetical protein
MTTPARRRRWIHPVLAFKKSHRGEPNPIWLNTQTAPFQVPVTLYLMLLGIQVLIRGVGPRSISDTFPTWLVVNWAAFMALGCLISLIGRYTQRFRLEYAGLGFLLYSCALYAVSVLVVAGWQGAFASGAYLAIGTGCGIRMYVISRSHKAQKVAGQMIFDRNGDAPE